MEIFKGASLSYERVKERVKEATYLISGLEVQLRQEGADSKNETFKAKDGLKEFVEFVNEAKTTLTSAHSMRGSYYTVEVEVAFQYTDDYNPNIISFVNNIKTRNGGTHELGLKTA